MPIGHSYPVWNGIHRRHRHISRHTCECHLDADRYLVLMLDGATDPLCHLGGAMSTNDWPLQLHDGTSYWNKLGYGTNRGPCTGSSRCAALCSVGLLALTTMLHSCSMALDHTLSLPTPIFQYITGLKQEHVGTGCTGTAVVAAPKNCVMRTL